LKLSLYSWGTCCIRYRNEMLIHIDTIVFGYDTVFFVDLKKNKGEGAVMSPSTCVHNRLKMNTNLWMYFNENPKYLWWWNAIFSTASSCGLS
jgi:hypothetical protein